MVWVIEGAAPGDPLHTRTHSQELPSTLEALSHNSDLVCPTRIVNNTRRYGSPGHRAAVVARCVGAGAERRTPGERPTIVRSQREDLIPY